MDTHRVGRRFETLAARWLEERGWTVLDRNVRFQRREIDLVVRRGGTVAFVEVKGRRSDDRGHPLEAVTARKRREIEAVARWWVAHHGVGEREFRFDAVAVRAVGRSGRVAIEHVEGAWIMGE
ncbi:YraN family protein [Gaopeijia maritima]|uniref:UPF0102 protein WI372_14830 n=1 Tax=Gaopeijia maritima TaxID=3119007 RepID=A0ABU9ECL2_9BACT